jgi:hypothetical protein
MPYLRGGVAMNPVRFDQLLRSYMRRYPRRWLNQTVLGLAVGSVLGASATERASAKKNKKHHKQNCRPCKKRKNGRCRGNKPNNSSCKGDGRCLKGICNPRPTCSPAGLGPCYPSCCSGGCIDIFDPGTGGFTPLGCPCSSVGRPCHETSDCCQPPSEPVPRSCVGYVCQ